MSLSNKLDDIRAGAEKNIPAPALAMMHRATQELEESGAAEQVISVGEKLPAFILENQFGELIDSNELLAHGPLILTVYRGLW